MDQRHLTLYDAAYAVCQAAGYAGGADWYARQLILSSGGLTLLANLCNVLAKTNPRFYPIKTFLVGAAVINCQLASDRTWREPHQDTRGDYPADTIVYIDLGGTMGRFAFHCRQDDPAYAETLARLTEQHIGWDGIPKQPIATDLIARYLGL